MRQILFIFLFSNALFGQDLQPGTYVNNFPEAGWFGTVLEIRPDSSFHYLHAGDLTRNEGEGHFTFSGDTLLLHFHIQPPRRDSIVFPNGDTVVAPPPRPSYFPLGFLVKRGKLYRVEKDGTVTRKAFGGRVRRRYLIFGRREGVKTRFYLELRQGVE